MGYTSSDVTNDLKFLIGMTRAFDVDKEGYLIQKESGKRHIVKLDATDAGRPVVMYQDPLPKGDNYIFNPFSEGMGKKSPSTNVFYKALRANFNVCLDWVMIYVINQALEHKKASEAKTEHNLSLTLIRMCSVKVGKRETVADIVDDEMVAEFMKLSERTRPELIQIAYIPSIMTSRPLCDALVDKQWDEKYGSDIRKKSLLAYKSILMGVLGISKPEDLATFDVVYDPDLNTSAKLYTTMMMYFKMISKFNEVIADATGIDGVPAHHNTFDLEGLHNVIENMKAAYAIAKHTAQPVVPVASPTSTGTVDTSGCGFQASANPMDRYAQTPVAAPAMIAPADPYAKYRQPGDTGFSQPAAAPNAPMMSGYPMTGGYMQPMGYTPGGFGYAPPMYHADPNPYGFTSVPTNNFGQPGNNSMRW